LTDFTPVIPQSKLDNPKYKKYFADKLRQEPDYKDALRDANDDEAIESVRELTDSNASREEWSQALEQMYGKPAPEKGISPALIAGATGLGLGAVGAALHIRSKFKGIEPKVEAPVEPPVQPTPPVAEARADYTKPQPTEFQQLQPSGGGLGKQAQIQANLPKGAGQIAPTSRAHQTFDPIVMHTLKRLENDPEYLANLDMLGGGRPQSHMETMSKAISKGPMTVEDISNWMAEKPVNTEDIARAGMTRNYWMEQFIQALRDNEPEASAKAQDILLKMEPGWNNMTSTPARATEFQKVFKMYEEVSGKIAELRASGAPSDIVRDELVRLLDAQRRELRAQKINKAAWKLVRGIEDYATRVKLTSPTTHEVNTVSNGLVFIQRAAERITTGVQAGAQGDPDMRDAYIKYAFGTWQGWTDAWGQSLKELVSDKNLISRKAERRLLQSDLEHPTSKYPLSVRLLNPYRWLAAADNFWKSIIVNSEFNTKAYMRASKEGLKGIDLAKRIEDLVSDPKVREVWLPEAEKVAREYTFQDDPDLALNALQAIQRMPFGRLIVPFIQTPYNIMTFYRRRSPFGFISASFYRDIKAGGLRRMEAISRISVGLAMTGGAYALYKLGNFTGPYPSNKKERDMWIAEGRRPWSVKIGNYWFQYSRYQPLGAYLMSIAALDETFKDSKFATPSEKSGSKLGRLLKNFVKGPLDLPLLQGLSTFSNMIQDPERNAERFEQLIAQGFFPNFLRDVTIQLDPVQRRPSNIKEAIAAIIPGLSKTVEPRIDVLGRELQYAPGVLARGSKVLTKANPSDKTKLMSDIGWAPPSPTTKLTFGGETVDLEGEMKIKYLKEMGSAASQAIDMVMSQENFGTWDNEQKKKVLRKVTQRLQENIRQRYKAYVGLFGDDKQEEAKALMGQ